MAQSVTQLSLEKFLNGIVQGLSEQQASKGIRASGKSSDSLRIEVTDDSGKIYGAGYLKFQTTGRGPGKPPPVANLEQWIRDKGLTPENGGIRGMAFAIQKKIAKQGTDIFLGRRPALSLSEIIEDKKGEVKERLLKGTKENIIKAIK